MTPEDLDAWGRETSRFFDTDEIPHWHGSARFMAFWSPLSSAAKMDFVEYWNRCGQEAREDFRRGFTAR